MVTGKWLYAIRNLASLMDRPASLQERVFQRLFEAAEIARFDRRERYEYEESLKVYRDWFSVMQTAELRGEQRGLEKGLKEGLKQGLQQGIRQVASSDETGWDLYEKYLPDDRLG